jgi:hypothetical protein
VKGWSGLNEYLNAWRQLRTVTTMPKNKLFYSKNGTVTFCVSVSGMLLMSDGPYDCQTPLRQRKRPIHRICKYSYLPTYLHTIKSNKHLNKIDYHSFTYRWRKVWFILATKNAIPMQK